MRRKFLYFKLYDLNENPQESQSFSALEMESIVGTVIPIDNIFQLSQQPEVKRVIEKDITLQNALTDTLPRRGRHGYLWVGDTLPDVVDALCRLRYIKEVFLFQQLLEPEPPFIKNSLKSGTYVEYDVNLWRVYKFWTYSYFYDRALHIGAMSKNETEIDNAFKALRDELNIPAGKLAAMDPSEMISFVPGKAVHNLNISTHQSSQKLLDSRWISAVLNYISTGEETHIYNPFSGNGQALLEAVFAGYQIHGHELNPVNALFSTANASVPVFEAAEFSRLTMELHSKIQMLLSASADTQTDLFLYSAEGQFINYWESEKRRLKSLELNPQLDHIMKPVAAVRFLIQSETITKSKPANSLLGAALINVMALAARKKDKINFNDQYSKALHEIYTRLYLLAKTKMFYAPRVGTATVANDCGMSYDVAEESFNGLFCFLPARINKNGFEKDGLFNAILNLNKSAEKLEPKLIGNKSLDMVEKVLLEKEISAHSGFYTTLSKEAHDLLARLELMGKQEDVLRVYQLWKKYYESILHFYKALKAGARMAVVMEDLEIKIENDVVTLPSVAVLKYLIQENETLYLEELAHLSRSELAGKPHVHKHVQVLLFKKSSHV